MIQLHETKPCSDQIDSIQAEGQISKVCFSLDQFEHLIQQLNFKVISIGNPKVLICKRTDCLLLVNSDGSFNISKVSSKNALMQIMQNIEKKILEEEQ